MKKNLVALFSAICIFCCGMTTFAANGAVTLYINSYMAYVGGEKTQIDPGNTEVAPLIENGRTLVPVRFVCEAFGGTASWNSDSRIVTLSASGKEISAKIGEKTLFVNGEAKEIDAPATISEGRTLLPLRAVAEALGKEVFYEDGFIAIGTADEINSAKASVNTETDFKQYMINKPAYACLYKDLRSGAMPGVLSGNVTLNQKNYSFYVSQTEGDYLANMTFAVNGITTDTMRDLGFRIYDMYLTDLNPRDDSVELFVTASTENDYICMLALSFDKYSAHYLNFTCYNPYYLGNSPETTDIFFLGSGDITYSGMRVSNDGYVILSHRGASAFHWGLETKFRLVGNTDLVQQQEEYYKVDAVKYLEPFAGDYPDITAKEKEQIKDGYVLCKKDFGFIKKGEYFTILYDNNMKQIYCVTRDGKSGWISIEDEGMNQYAEVNGYMFYLAG